MDTLTTHFSTEFEVGFTAIRVETGRLNFARTAANRLFYRAGLRRMFWLAAMIMAFSAIVCAQDVVTYHNDNARTGQNLKETILNLTNVKSSTFGLLFTMPVDGKIDAEPLYLSSVSIPGQGVHNVLYVVTENDSLYAFDADTGAQLWQVSVLGQGETASDDFDCQSIYPQIGITSTPVIDRSSGPNGTIYLVAMSKDSNGNYFQRLHALDVTTGSEEFGGPTAIEARYPGHGDNHRGKYVYFDPKQYAERQALLLLNGVIYTAWSSHCDVRPYTGWVIGYSESTLKQTSVVNLTPNGNRGSIWMSGAGLASDGSNIYFLDANGSFDTTLDANGFPVNGNFGNSFIKLTTKGNKLKVADYFTMWDTVEESKKDGDFGSGGALLLPDMKDGNNKTWQLAIGAGKDSAIYIVDRNNLGKFNSDNDIDIYQEIDNELPGGIWSMPAYFNGSVYYGPSAHNLMQFTFSQAKLATASSSISAVTYPYPGSTPSISANQTQNGIVWAIRHFFSKDSLHAYDATNLKNELYNSNQAGTRDHFGSASHFGTPLIANGKVYVGTDTNVTAFGLLKQMKPAGGPR